MLIDYGLSEMYANLEDARKYEEYLWYEKVCKLVI